MSQDDVIRITEEEAFSEHVDDLLKRQASLRGDPGISRDRRKRSWFLQSWFVLMIAGAIAAFTAWGLLEPVYDDALYWQGEVESLGDEVPEAGDVEAGLGIAVMSTLRVRGVNVWIADSTRVIMPDGSIDLIAEGQVQKGDEVGLYLDYGSSGDDYIALARHVVLAPSPDTAQGPGVALEQLATRNALVGKLLLFPLIAGLVGLAVGAADGIICRMPRRMLLGGGIGLLIGLVGGLVSSFIADIIYGPLYMLAQSQSGDAAGGLSSVGFLLQLIGRSLAWGVAGMAMGLGQGVALRSGRLALYGFLGGVIGGLLGGLLFDPIYFFAQGGEVPSAWLSRGVGFTIIGAAVGLMIGVVELLARDAWLRMLEGPLAGKEFLIFKDTMRVGASPRSEVYLFNDDKVADEHAVIRTIGEAYEIENLCQEVPVTVNGVPVTRTRLRHGDQLTLGRTVFLFQRRRG